MKLRNLKEQSFAPYGNIIRIEYSEGDTFQVVVTEPEASGWQIAISRKTRKPITHLGLHPNSRESFEPLTGVGVIIVALLEQPEAYEAFLLDKPVCLYKNVWHATISLTEFAQFKITENTSVDSIDYELKHPIDIGIVAQ